MASWFAEELHYQQTTGLELQFSRSGYLQIQTPNNELLSYSFIGWWHQYSYSTSYKWWHNKDSLAAIKDSNSEADLLNQLQYINLKQDEYPGEDYYLMLPKLEKSPFIEIDGIYIEADGDDPLYDGGLFSQFLKSGYELVNIQDAELDIADLFNSVGRVGEDGTWQRRP